MTTDEQDLYKLGFDKIRERLEALAATDGGKALAHMAAPTDRVKALKAELETVEECRKLFETEENFRFEVKESMTELLEESRTANAWLSIDELFRLLRWLRMVRDVGKFLRSKRETYPRLARAAEPLGFDDSLIPAFEQVMDDRGNWKDSASPRLKALRRESMDISSSLRQLLNRMLRHAKQQNWTTESELTIRNDRLVIPLNADFKGRIRGFVHDVSQSGQTIFLEPQEALDMNNRLRRVAAEEQNEKIRILTELTARIGAEAPRLLRAGEAVSQLDFIRARGRMALELGAVLPRFDKEGEVHLIQAYHPVLLYRVELKRNAVVPVSLRLDENERILLVSGPNAGGKSVTLKTMGLLQVMLQSGMLVPVDDRSHFRLFSRLFVDIGDEQSIQSDLSTYTSHLQTMREMVRNMDANSLFLLDEFGSGTDPRLGGAIAEAFLEAFLGSGAIGIITSHYGNLKQFAEQHEGILNGAMQFDPRTLSPTYRLETGMPGRSYAFEIAAKAGIPQEIIEKAREKLEGEEVQTEELLRKVETQRAELEEVLRDNTLKNKELSRLVERNRLMQADLEKNKKQIIRQAHTEAENLIKSANAKIERTIREIKEAQAEREATKELRKELEEMLPPPPEAEPEVLPEERPGEVPQAGDHVRIRDTENYGQLLEVDGKRAVVAIGDLRVTARLKNLVKVSPPSQDRKQRSGKGAFLLGRKQQAARELDVQGLRVEAALPVVSKFIDDALLSGLTELRILHGKGTGALREAIREYLRKYPEVTDLQDEHVERGGAGWTLVTLRKAE